MYLRLRGESPVMSGKARIALASAGLREDLMGQLGPSRGEALDEVGGGLALALVEVALDPIDEDGSTPAVFDRRKGGTRSVPRAA
jgi:hypothetical protein